MPPQARLEALSSALPGRPTPRPPSLGLKRP